MLKTEFQKIAGYEVSDQDYYNIIEPMYYAINADKADFIKCLDRKRFEIIPAKSPEIIQLENKLKEELSEEKRIIKRLRDDLIRYKEYYQEDKDDYWKRTIKTQRYIIQRHENRINQIKFILA